MKFRVPADAEDEAAYSAEVSRGELGAAGVFLFSAGAQESEHLAALNRMHLLDPVPEGQIDQYTQQARDYFRVSSSIVALLDDRRIPVVHHWSS